MLKSNYIVVYDTEYTAWEGSQERNWSESWEHREIIQIAALKLHVSQRFQEICCFDRIVRPLINSVLSDYIMNLTGLTQFVVDRRGVLFRKALADFHYFCCDGKLPVYSWGGIDHVVLMENCNLCGFPFPSFEGGFFDIREKFEKFGVNTALYNSGTVYQSAGICLEGQQHDATFDVRSMVAALKFFDKWY
jgi:inhibitor of KinA sporulation pathway (predicted exonuclease)